MNFDDLTVQQLKKILSIYRYHLIEPLKNYTKNDKEKLLKYCKAFLKIDNEKISPIVIEPLTFDIPAKVKRRTRARIIKEKPKVVKTADNKKNLLNKNIEKYEKKLKNIDFNKIKEGDVFQIFKENKKENEKKENEKKENEKKEKIQYDDFIYGYNNRKFEEEVELEPINDYLNKKQFEEIKKNKNLIVEINMNEKYEKYEKFLTTLIMNITQINKMFQFRLYSRNFNKANFDENDGTSYLFSFTILNDKIFLNGWTELTKTRTNNYYIELLNGYRGGGTNIINYMKKKVGNNNYFYLSSLETRATVDFYRKMGLKCDENIFKNFKLKYDSKLERMIKKINDYDELYEELSIYFSRTVSYFYYFPNKKVMEKEYPNFKLIPIPAGREWIEKIVETELKLTPEKAEKWLDKLIEKTIKKKGKLEGTGKFCLD